MTIEQEQELREQHYKNNRFSPAARRHYVNQTPLDMYTYCVSEAEAQSIQAYRPTTGQHSPAHLRAVANRTGSNVFH